MKIVKLENGNILLKDGDNVVKRLPSQAVLTLTQEGEAVGVLYGHQNKHDIYAETITATQLEPALEVPFSGTAQDLNNLLSESFFFSLGSSSGGFTYDTTIQHDFLTQRVTNVSGIQDNEFISQPLDVLGDVTIESVTLEVTTGGAVGCVGVVGIYSVDENGQQDKLLASTEEYDLTIVGEQTIALSTPVELNFGRYVVAFSRNTALGLFMRIVNVRRYPFGVSGTSSLTRSSTTIVYDGTMPEDAPAANYLTGAVPYIKYNLA